VLVLLLLCWPLSPSLSLSALSLSLLSLSYKCSSEHASDPLAVAQAANIVKGFILPSLGMRKPQTERRDRERERGERTTALGESARERLRERYIDR